MLDRGAHATASLALALRAAAAAAPTLIAPDGHTELGPVLRCPTAYRCLPVILAGTLRSASLPMPEPSTCGGRRPRPSGSREWVWSRSRRRRRARQHPPPLSPEGPVDNSAVGY